MATTKAILSLCYVFSTFLAFGQNFNFEKITVEDGLSQSQVLDLFEASTGEIWIGTASGGVSIFDGREFDILSSEQGLPSNTVYDIHESGDTLFISTLHGIAVYTDAVIDTIDALAGLSSELVYASHRKGNQIWIGTKDGLDVLDVDTRAKIESDSWLKEARVYDFYEDSSGILWLSTLDRGIIGQGDSQIKIDAAAGLKSNTCFGTVQYGDYHILLTIKGVSVARITDGNVQLVDPAQVFGDQWNESPMVNRMSQSALVDSKGRLWIGGDKFVSLFDGEKLREMSPGGLINGKNIGAIIEDRDGNIWCGSQELGLTKISNRAFQPIAESEGVFNPIVNAFAQDPSGAVWIGTDKGLHLVGDSVGPRLHFRDGLVSNKVTCLEMDPYGSLWIGTNAGISQYQNSTFTNYENLDGQEDYNYALSLEWTDDGLLAATPKGVARIEFGKIVPYDIDGLPEGLEITDLEYSLGELWIGSTSGLFLYSDSTTHQFLPSSGFTATRVSDIFRDEDSTIWVGSDNGAFRFEAGNFRHFNITHGVSSNSISAIGQQARGVLWLGMNNGVNQVQIIDNEVVRVNHFGPQNGFRGAECNPRAILSDSQGRVWFGTNSGLNIFDPKHDIKNELPPILRIKEVQLFSQPTDWAVFDVQSFAGVPDKPYLPYDQNFVTVHFEGVSHKFPALVKYRYRLNGGAWSETSDRQISFSNLQPMNYRFDVKACSADGVWSEPASFEFAIRPPFWKSWVFYAICAAIGVYMILSYFQIRSKNSRISEINGELVEQQEVISQKNKDITDSIHYAKRIQDAVFPPPQKIDLPRTFIFFRPKDIVSGDFYWFRDLGEKSLFAVADCTGHGVPGAFMSIISYNLLDKIVGIEGLTKPAAILDRLNAEISKTLHESNGGVDPVRDGLDIAICSFDRANQTLEFSGAFHPLTILRHGEILKFKGNRFSVGGALNGDRKFENQTIKLEKGDMMYLYTDGYADQFGGAHAKKYKSQRFRELLVKIHDKPITEQQLIVSEEFVKWKGRNEQVDDVLVLGTKL